MPRRGAAVALCLALLGLPALVQTLLAEVTVEQRRELTELKRELAQVTALLRDKDFDAADKLLSDAEAKVNSIATAAQVQPTDRSMQGVAVLIQRHREALAKARARVPGLLVW